MIIWLASYPKSGNTWIRSFLNTLLFSKTAIAPLKPGSIPIIFITEVFQSWHWYKYFVHHLILLKHLVFLKFYPLVLCFNLYN